MISSVVRCPLSVGNGLSSLKVLVHSCLVKFSSVFVVSEARRIGCCCSSTRTGVNGLRTTDNGQRTKNEGRLLERLPVQHFHILSGSRTRIEMVAHRFHSLRDH